MKKGHAKSSAFRRAGFTLVELLVSISIIAILTAILLPNFMGARQKASDSQMIQDMNSIKSALRLYYNDHQSYPVGNVIDVQPLLSGYMTPTGIGFTYCQTNTGDGFLLYAHLGSTQGSDTVGSQTRCGVTSPVCGGPDTLPSNLLYFVCAN
jgi:prepilin-type N-terminal cleavage/methylation domain-containing protein